MVMSGIKISEKRVRTLDMSELLMNLKLKKNSNLTGLTIIGTFEPLT